MPDGLIPRALADNRMHQENNMDYRSADLAQVGQLKNMFDQFSLEVGDCGTGHELLFESAV
jgi:hypothetical protein